MAHRAMQYKKKNTNIPAPFLKKALRSMPKEERDSVLDSCSRIENRVRSVRNADGEQAKAMFGRNSSMELLSQLGMFLIAVEQADGDPDMLSLRKQHVMNNLLSSVS